MIAEKSLLTLEYDKVMNKLSKYAVSSYTKQHILSMRPYDDYDEIIYELKNVREAYITLYELTLSPNLFYDDISAELNIAKINGVLSAGELLKIASVARNARLLKALIDSINHPEVANLHSIGENLYDYSSLEEDINKAIISDTEISDNASPKLAAIRREINSTLEKIRRKLNAYISDSKYQQYLQDTIITIRNNRQVIPVKSECRSFIPGLIHDQSQSGSTVYIEPLIIVELNNDLKTLYLDEANEIQRILKDFTERIKLISDNLAINIDTMCYVDSIFAKAIYAHEYDCILPEIATDGTFRIVNGRHPLLDKKSVVPVTIYLEGNNSVLLVTGSNTGGKTVSLKLVGLLNLMAMSGMFIPADDGSKVSLYNNIYCDIGDEQSIEQSLSTFSSHIVNLINITKSMDSHSLILLDELGAGTDPAEGSALAIAIAKKIIEINAKAIITTHYNELKEFAFSSDRIETASMDFDPVTYKPTYRLLMGIVGSSNAIEIASRLGLDKEIIKDAKSIISDEKISFDKVMAAAEQSRKKAEEYAKEIENDKKLLEEKLAYIEEEKKRIIREKEKLNENMQKEAKKLLENYMEEANELVEELNKTVKVKTEQSLFKARNLRNKINNLSYREETKERLIKYDDSEIKEGDSVYIGKIDSIGKIVAINERKKEYTVKAGFITTTAKFGDVKKVVADNISASQNSAKTIKRGASSNIPASDGKYEINVIGQNVEEAIFNVDQFIDEAVLANMAEVRVVHGKGKGILRSELRKHFRNHPSIASFREGVYGEGDAGVTILELK